MSAREQKKEVILDQVQMISQLKEAGRMIEEILVIVNVKEIYDPSISDRFYLQIVVRESTKSNSLAGAYSKSDILEDGSIILGTLYMLGPIDRDSIIYEASMRYIVE